MENSEDTDTHYPQHPNPGGEVGAGSTQHQEEVSSSHMGVKHVAVVVEKTLIS